VGEGCKSLENEERRGRRSREKKTKRGANPRRGDDDKVNNKEKDLLLKETGRCLTRSQAPLQGEWLWKKAKVHSEHGPQRKKKENLRGERSGLKR